MIGNEEEPDIYVVGFQEIVELSPQQVMATDAEKRKIWEQQIEKTLNFRSGAKSKYTMLRSNQLVGAALIIFVKSDIVDEIRNVETSIKKVCTDKLFKRDIRIYCICFRLVLWGLLETKAL